MESMGFSQAVKTCFSKYATFSGRARRSEFWRFAQLILIISFLLGFIPVIIRFFILDFIIKMLEILAWLVFLIPSLAVSARRLHDIGKSGWWLLLGFIPIAGPIVLLVWFCTDSQPGENQWGANPKETTNEDGSIVA